jgi:hypothetical protein
MFEVVVVIVIGIVFYDKIGIFAKFVGGYWSERTSHGMVLILLAKK